MKNYHINPELKISLFHTINNGSKDDAVEGITLNNYYKQDQIGVIKSGDIAGFGLSGVF